MVHASADLSLPQDLHVVQAGIHQLVPVNNADIAISQLKEPKIHVED
jgi:hypothetical protein